MSAPHLHPQSLHPSVTVPTQRAVNEDFRSEHPSQTSIAAHSVEDDEQDLRRLTLDVTSGITAPSGPIIQAYSSPPSQEATASTTAPNGGGYSVNPDERCRCYGKDILSRFTPYAELCDTAKLLGVRKADVHSSLALPSRDETLPNHGDGSQKKKEARRRVKEIRLKLQTRWTNLVRELLVLAA
ncbi:hypothetical protein PQX77_020816 [Marasmius sp. AFHP31]|nr:hypothetical protein PQX77_020816 [Marasmius sp. AFHP31]